LIVESRGEATRNVGGLLKGRRPFPPEMRRMSTGRRELERAGALLLGGKGFIKESVSGVGGGEIWTHYQESGEKDAPFR